MKHSFRLMVSVALVSTLVAGCGSARSRQGPDQATGSQQPISTGATTDSADIATVGAGSSLDSPYASGAGAPLAVAVVYFAYDDSTLSATAMRTLEPVISSLLTDRGATIRIEGHTDERGSAEYNVALGERRAQAVRRALLLRGVNDARIVTVSYGEERPAVDGATESAWVRNRRAEVRVAVSNR